MLNTRAIVRQLADVGIPVEHADAITDAIRQAAESPADMATKADLAHLRADIHRAMLIQAGAIVGAVVAILRMLGS